MYPVTPELVSLWIRERQDRAAEHRLARLVGANAGRVSLRSLVERLAGRYDRTPELGVCTEAC